VPAALWTELMRTRTLANDADEGLVAWLQQQSGCRIHIERERQEVRIFGPGEEVVVAERLLEDLAERCGEEHVAVDTAALDKLGLLALAESCGVTLRVETGQLTVLGLRPAVAQAVQALRRHITSPNAYLWGEPPPAEADGGRPLMRPTQREHARTAAWHQQAEHAAAMPEAALQQPPRCRAPGSARQPGIAAEVTATDFSCVDSAAWPHDTGEWCRFCPTCGTGRFCVFCGAPAWQQLKQHVAKEAADAAAFDWAPLVQARWSV